jgi:hypothetical protein
MNASTSDLTTGMVGVVDYGLSKKNILGYQTGDDIYAQNLAQGRSQFKINSDKTRAEIVRAIAVEKYVCA